MFVPVTPRQIVPKVARVPPITAAPAPPKRAAIFASSKARSTETSLMPFAFPYAN